MEEPMGAKFKTKQEFLNDLFFGDASGMSVEVAMSRQDPELDQWLADNMYLILDVLHYPVENELQAKTALIFMLLGTNIRKQVEIFELNKALEG